ncbi:MAG TPA: hypothetical protein VFD31_07470 [Thermoleophilaceae bacterium]|nr:hypothetical protein [Thermoleophilaceae bacterium]
MEASEGQSSQHTKRVVLPSGRTIEVVYVKDACGEAKPAAPAVQPDQALQSCNSCGSNLVYPLSWEEAGENAWAVSLRCPDCEARRDGIFNQKTVEAFDEELDLGTDALTSDYRRLCRANMADEIDLFVAAIEADAILPEDF